MSDLSPNTEQERLIDARDGVYVVDAGPGTGKTFTVTRRYAALLDDGYEADDILLVTFTNNAATEMKERVVANCGYSMAKLRDAPINTFHGFCHNLLTERGFEAPQLLGIDDRITPQTRVLEDEVLEAERFEEFCTEFLDRHQEYANFFRVVRQRTSLLGLINQLAAKGIFPTADGWFRNGRTALEGDRTAFDSLFAEANAPNEGARGPINSDLKNRLSGFSRDRCLPPSAPSETALRGDGNAIDVAWGQRAFDEDRDELMAFVHDIYHEYVAYALGRNYLNFGFLQMFAYALLCEDHTLREQVAFEHVMVDEFQDNSEIQFKLALLLAGGGNLCVVGDWKQSIYSFQYAAVENITNFEDRLERFATDLNDDANRVTVAGDSVERIQLRQNYRSTAPIIELSEASLSLPATKTEEVDPEPLAEITELEATTDRTDSRLEAFTASEEHDAILDRVQTIVDNEAYAVQNDGGEYVAPSYDDIAVLTRTRDFGRELQARAAEFDIPVAYEGGVALYDTPQAVLLLAWLRLLENRHSTRGWAVVLEEAGYTLDEVEYVLETEDYPTDMLDFRDRLTGRETVGTVARQVFDRYGFEDAYADALVTRLEETFGTTSHTRGDLVRYMERSLAAEATPEIEDSPGGDSLTVQTIHAAKGLEHPIVIVANVNQHRFPAVSGGADRIRFEEPIGLRQTKYIDDPHGHPYQYDNWRYQVLSACLDPDYDEERRLMYVAISRAERHVLFTAGESPSTFFEHLPLAPTALDPSVSIADTRDSQQTRLDVTFPLDTAPADRTPHSLMDDTVFEDVEGGGGTDFGSQVHEFAEDYALGSQVSPSNDHEEHVAAFLDGLEGELAVEERAYLPLDVNGQRAMLSGIIDLLHLTDRAVEIIDFKTDAGRYGREEYRKQLSVYYHVVRQVYPDRGVSTSIFWTGDNERDPVEPLPLEDLASLIEFQGGPKRDPTEHNRIR